MPTHPFVIPPHSTQPIFNLYTYLFERGYWIYGLVASEQVIEDNVIDIDDLEIDEDLTFTITDNSIHLYGEE